MLGALADDQPPPRDPPGQPHPNNTPPVGIDPAMEYRKRTESAQNIAALNVGLFGDEVNLYNGSTAFSVVDVDVPGNFDLPVRFARRLSVEIQPQS